MSYLRVGGDHRRSGGDRHSLSAQVSTIRWYGGPPFAVPPPKWWMLGHGGWLFILLALGVLVRLFA